MSGPKGSRRKKRADYVLALKGNLCKDVKEYFETKEICNVIELSGNYKRTCEKTHGQIEIREYYQTEDIKWLSKKKEWEGLKRHRDRTKDDRKVGKKDLTVWGVKYYSTFVRKAFHLALFDGLFCDCAYHRNYLIGNLDYKMTVV